jgi:hypothetical protein
VRIFAIFIDMLSTDYLSHYNSNATFTEIDRFISTIGGNLFKNCYVSGPDTCRSMSNFWSGKFHYNNGCTTRQHAPRLFLNSPSLLDILIENGFSLHILTDTPTINSGFFPNDSIKFYLNDDYSINDFVLTIELLPISEKVFIMITINDYHDSINHLGANHDSVLKGHQNVIKKINQTPIDFIENSDLFIVFSDHGHIMSRHYMKSRFSLLRNNKLLAKNLLGDYRTKLLMLIRKKEDNLLIYNDKLTSNVDIVPTILNFLDIPYKVESFDGKDLFSDQKHKLLLFEDFITLRADRQVLPEVWGIILPGKQIRTVNKFDSLESIDSKLKMKISENLSSFNDYLKVYSLNIIYQRYLSEFELVKNAKISKYIKNFLLSIKRYLRNKIYFLKS